MLYEGEIDNDRCRWEYYHISSDVGDNYQTFTEKLNTFGFDGWEVINIVESKDYNPISPTKLEWKAWLKRQYRFERKRVFKDDFPDEDIPIGGELRDYYYV